MDYIKQFDNKIETGLKSVIKISYVSAIAHFLLVLYAAKLAPTLPPVVLDLFNNQYFRLFVFSIVLWTANVTPSISILIALGFMVSVNAANKQQLWEFLENTNTTSIDQGVQAVEALAQAAGSSVPVAINDVVPVADIAVSASKTTEGVKAIQALASQATQPIAATQEAVEAAKNIAVESIVSPSPSIDQIPTAPIDQGVQAVKILAQAAMSPEPMVVSDVNKVANIAVSAATTNEGVQAIQALANQAAQPSAATPESTQAAANVAVQSIIAPTQVPTQAQAPVPVQAPAPVPAQQAPQVPAPAPQTEEMAGCYPMRRYDMSKVEPDSDTKQGFETYQTWSG